MSDTGINAAFLTSAELESFGIRDASERDIKIHKTAVIVDFSSITFGSHIRIDPFVVISCKSLVIGDYVHIGGGCSLSGAAEITLGDFSGLSNRSMLFSSSDDYSGESLTNPTVPQKFTNAFTAPVSVGDHAILGAGSIVLPGVTIGAGVSTGAGALIKHNLEEWCIYAGSPARKIRERSRSCLTLEQELRAAEAETSSVRGQ